MVQQTHADSFPTVATVHDHVFDDSKGLVIKHCIHANSELRSSQYQTRVITNKQKVVVVLEKTFNLSRRYQNVTGN